MSLSSNLSLALRILPIEFFHTLYMVFLSTLCALLIGIPLGILLTVTKGGRSTGERMIYRILGTLVNIGRSIPFAILIVAIFPLTRWIVGTSIGTTASIVPLTIAAIPFVARVVEGALETVESSVIEAAIVMGSSRKQIIQKVLLPEALPGILQGITLTIVNLIGYSAMAGLIGGGGLGKVAIQYGYQRFNSFLLLSTLFLLVLLVEGVQWVGNRVVKKILKKRGKWS